MLIGVNGVRLFVDMEGVGLVPDGEAMREKPTLILLHGGPGFDHSLFKPAFSALSDVAQIVYYDHRGNGRSEDGDRSLWTLDQWADDVKGLCDALGIERPIVLGMSFGGYVAQAYAARYPEHPSKLVLVSTTAKVEFPAMFEAFGRLGGPEARSVAETYWMAPTAERRAEYMRVCLPLYSRTPLSSDAKSRAFIRNETALRFNGPDNEHGRLDFRRSLNRVECAVLVMAGDRDPMMPVAFTEALVAALSPERTRFELFEGCGHQVFSDEPDRAFAILREFISGGMAA